MSRRRGVFSIILAFILILGSTTNVFTADKKFIEQVEKEFTNYNEKRTKTKMVLGKMKSKSLRKYNKKEKKSLDFFISQTAQDVNYCV